MQGSPFPVRIIPDARSSSLSTVARKIPFDDPEVLNYVRVGYVTTQLIILGVYYYVSITVRRRFISRVVVEWIG